MEHVPTHILEMFSPEDIVDTSAYVDDCRCQCRQHITVQDGLLNVHGRAIFDRLLVKGSLILPDNQEIRRLPDVLAVTGTVNLTKCSRLEVMPSQMFADRVMLSGSSVRELPAHLMAGDVDVRECPNLVGLPAALEVRRLRAAGCHKLETVPAGLKLATLDLSGCPITTLPADLTVTHELRLQNCARLSSIEDGATVQTGIDVRGCDMLFTLPPSVQPAIAVTDGMMLAHNWMVVPTMSSEEAAMCLGVKAAGALPHRHFKNLRIMQEAVVSVDRQRKGVGRGRAVATLQSGAGKQLPAPHVFRGMLMRLEERRLALAKQEQQPVS